MGSFLEKYVQKGIKYVICTDISKDGMLQGSAVNLYKSILEKFPDLKVIASGGVTNYQEISELQNVGCYGAIIGKALLEGRLELKKLIK